MLFMMAFTFGAIVGGTAAMLAMGILVELRERRANRDLITGHYALWTPKKG